MGYDPVVIEQFKGLDLRSDPIEVGAGSAIDLLNVDFDGPGRVRCRDGATKLNTTTGAGSNVWLMAGNYGGTSMLAPIRANAGALSVDKLVANGTLTTGVAAFPGGFTEVHDSVNFGLPTASRAYIAMRGQTLQKFSGAALANSTGKPRFLAAWNNRLVQANYAAAADTPSAANGSTSTVFFSTATDPDTYNSTDWVQVRPGDGQEIIGMASWENQLFVFKQTAVFVFSAASTGIGPTGLAEFNYRQVELPMGVITPGTPGSGGAFPTAICVGADGVYFVSPEGIFRTSGGVPVEISGKIQGVFSSTASSSIATAQNSGYLYWSKEHLFFLYNTEAGPTRALVWDRLSGEWTIWDCATSGVVSWDGASSAGATLTYFLSSGLGASNVFYLDNTSGLDNGNSVSWFYQSGHYPLAKGTKATVREIVLSGTGTVTLKFSVDTGVVDIGGSVTLGVSPAIADGFQRISRQGRLFSHYISGTGQAIINRIDLHVREVRVVQ